MRTILYFHSKSAIKPPGQGVNEIIDSRDSLLFAPLMERDPDWRKVLSNFYQGDFVYSGSCYKTAEHAFQAAKISIVSQEKAREFTKESGSALGLGDGNIARKHRKLILLNEDQLLEWNRRKNRVMKEILFSKFSQVDHAKQILLATRDAELWHGTRGLAKSRQYMLEEVRTELQRSQTLTTRSDIEQDSILPKTKRPRLSR